MVRKYFLEEAKFKRSHKHWVKFEIEEDKLTWKWTGLLKSFIGFKDVRNSELFPREYNIILEFLVRCLTIVFLKLDLKCVFPSDLILNFSTEC